MSLKHYEDIEVEETFTAGGYEMGYEEVIEFAEQYDPQPFHTEKEPEVRALFGDMVASGWHTAAVSMRLLVECFNSNVAILGSPGMDELRWPNPVEPGDTLSFEMTVREKRRSQSGRPFGIVTGEWLTTNQDDNPVLTGVNPMFVKTRE